MDGNKLAEVKLEFDTPPKPEWEWCVGGDWLSGTWHVRSGPHLLGRILQRWLLDIHWRRIVSPKW